MLFLSDLRKICKYRFKKRYDLHVHIYLIENRRRNKKKLKMTFFLAILNSKMKTKMPQTQSFYISRRAYYYAKHRRLFM